MPVSVEEKSEQKLPTALVGMREFRRTTEAGSTTKVTKIVFKIESKRTF